ncbi:flagellar basal body-associated protein FliL [Bacillus solimangrovi]|uniref:Flagellar protein FliL n=1 Tax=Bacillus solimangrovi TaxID=1305675 RepID=A0A1E5LBA8_9BACI|nr:flagellar basal body-associated protein FliL [Bacillus solimangrovi]OEH91269.1 flagellar basal body-associated protein FliL [Bacillus solimangrovi]
MLKNKLVSIVLILLAAITLLGVVALFVILNFAGDNNEHAEPTIDEILEQSVETDEITTNLLSNDFIRIKFRIQTDSEDAKEELAKRTFQVRNILIQELSSMKAADFKGKEKLIELESMLKMRLNEIMQEGTIEKVYITDFVLQ